MNASYRQLERFACWPRQLDAGRYVFHQGDEPKAVYLVLCGTVRLARLSLGGSEVTLALVGQGECFGEAEILAGIPERECFAETVCPAVIQTVLRDDLPEDALAALRQVAVDRLYRAQLCMADMVAETPHRRVASLLRHLSSQGSTVRLSQSDIGRATGCLRETVSKALSRLEKAGAVQVERCAITILDPELLEA